MSKELLLDEILQQGTRPLGKLSGPQVIVGRDPAEGLKIDNHAVSREHGVFLRIRNHWFFKDLGSTNGSWRNGRMVKEGQIVLVRPGDVLQLADTPVRVAAAQEGQPGGGYGGFPAFSSSTLIVFSGDNFHDEFPLPEYGRALVVGGNQADLRISEDVNELPRLVVERRGDRVCAYGVSEGPPILRNGEEVSETVDLEDGDELQVGQYRILFNDPRSERPVEQAAAVAPGQFAAAASEPQAAATGVYLREWDTAASAPAAGAASTSGRFTFGRSQSIDEEDVEGTLAIDPAEMEAKLAGYDMHPASRYAAPEQGPSGGLHALEDKLIVLIGFALLLVLVGVVVWWVFF